MNGYEKVMEPNKCKKDIAYCLNYLLHENDCNFIAINAACEQTTLGQRRSGRSLIKQDEFIRYFLEKKTFLSEITFFLFVYYCIIVLLLYHILYINLLTSVNAFLEIILLLGNDLLICDTFYIFSE